MAEGDRLRVFRTRAKPPNAREANAWASHLHTAYVPVASGTPKSFTSRVNAEKEATPNLRSALLDAAHVPPLQTWMEKEAAEPDRKHNYQTLSVEQWDQYLEHKLTNVLLPPLPAPDSEC
eukprot:gene20123-26853_t